MELPFPRTYPDPRTVLTPEPGTNSTYRVAVVGNGPLRDADRPLIAAYRNVVRFNDAKNRLPGERTTVHVNPYSAAGTFHPRVERNASFWVLVKRWDEALAHDHALVSLNYERKDYPSVWNLGHYVPQTLGPWAETLHVFPRCANCTGDRCLLRRGWSGMSSGGTVIEQLDGLTPPLEEIAVFGMNWNENCLDSLDFLDRALVRDCCARCRIHPTATDDYLPPGFESFGEEVRRIVARGVGALLLTTVGFYALLACRRYQRSGSYGRTGTLKEGAGREGDGVGRLARSHRRDRGAVAGAHHDALAALVPAAVAEWHDPRGGVPCEPWDPTDDEDDEDDVDIFADS